MPRPASGYLSGSTLGKYQVISLIGSGGMGEVYRAEDLELQRAVALKVLPEHLVGDERMERFVREARSASALNHPHLLAFLRTANGSPCPAGPACATPSSSRISIEQP